MRTHYNEPNPALPQREEEDGPWVIDSFPFPPREGVGGRLVRLALFLLACLVPIPCHSQGAIHRTITTVPYRTFDTQGLEGVSVGMPVIPVLVNGHHAWFGFDTGTSDVFVTEEYAHRAGLYRTMPARIRPASGRPTSDAPSADPVTVRIGPLTFSARVLSDKDADLARLVPGPIDGLLGEKAIENAAVLLSQTHQTLTFYVPGNLTPQEREDIGMGNAAAAPVTLTETHLLSAVAVFRQQSATVSEDLLIDTGANDTVISENSFRELKGRVVATDTLATVWGNEEETTFTVDQTVLGGLTINDPLLSYSADRRIQVPLVLGRNILSRFDLLIDVPALTMYLSPSREPRLPW